MGQLKSATRDVELRKRARKIARALAKAYPDAVCALRTKTRTNCWSATILSAQCTDERVNLVTPGCFAGIRRPKSLARSSQADVERIIKSTGFFRAKAKSLRGMAAKLVGRIRRPDAADDRRADEASRRRQERRPMSSWEPRSGSLRASWSIRM